MLATLDFALTAEDRSFTSPELRANLDRLLAETTPEEDPWTSNSTDEQVELQRSSATWSTASARPRSCGLWSRAVDDGTGAFWKTLVQGSSGRASPCPRRTAAGGHARSSW